MFSKGGAHRTCTESQLVGRPSKKAAEIQQLLLLLLLFASLLQTVLQLRSWYVCNFQTAPAASAGSSKVIATEHTVLLVLFSCMTLGLCSVPETVAQSGTCCSGHIEWHLLPTILGTSNMH